jgi:anti-sigma factor RsiW
VTCSWCEERFERFLDGILTGGEHARLVAHVDRCNACRGLLEELRVVDALLLAPRAVELPADFTSATMSDVRAMPAPRTRCAPIAALLVAYTVAAWSLAGAALLIAPDAVLSAYRSALAVTGTVAAAFAGLGHTFALLGGSVIVADGIVLVAAVAALRVLRPRIAERLRW